MDPVKIAIVGMGRMGSDLARVCNDLPQADLVAVCEARDDRRAAMASELVVPSYADHDEMLAQHPEIEVVDVATQASPQFKVPPCLAAIEAGKTLIAEGPLSDTVQAAQQIVDAAEASGVRLFMNNSSHFEPRCGAARKAIRAGEIGEVLHLSLRHNLRREAGQYRNWEFSIVWEISWYDLALLRWLTGREIVRVLARGLEKDAGTHGPAAVVSLLTFDDGSLAVLENGWASPQVVGRRTTTLLEVRGSKGIIDVDLYESGARVYTSDSLRPLDILYAPTIHGGGWSGIFRDQMAYQMHCVRSGAEPSATGRDGLAEVRLCDAIHRSMDTGLEISLA